MELNKYFDSLIKKTETNSANNTSGYSINGRVYENYLDNL